MVQLYQLNIAHRLFHLADWKFCYLNFCARNRRRLKKWKIFVDSLYNYDYSEVNDEESSEEEEAAIVGQNQSITRRLVSQNWSVTLTVAVKKTSTLSLFLMNQLTWPLINFLF